MRTIAGAIIILAGAILAGFGTLAVTLAPGANAPQNIGMTAVISGAAFCFIGIVVIVFDRPIGR